MTKEFVSYLRHACRSRPAGAESWLSSATPCEPGRRTNDIAGAGQYDALWVRDERVRGQAATDHADRKTGDPNLWETREGGLRVGRPRIHSDSMVARVY